MSENQKKHYLQAIRSTSSYPVYRGAIGLLSLAFYVLGGFQIFGAIILAIMAGSDAGFFGGLIIFLVTAVGGLITILIGKLLKEGLLIIADIGDSVVEHNAKHSDK